MKMKKSKLTSKSELYKLLATKYKKSPEAIKQITDHPWEWMRLKIKEEPGAKFLFHNLGSFRASKLKVYRYIRLLINKYRNGQMTYEEIVPRIRRSWEIRNTIIKYERN